MAAPTTVQAVVTWFSSRLPPRQAVDLSGGTHHRVDAGGISFRFRVSQPTVTVVRG